MDVQKGDTQGQEAVKASFLQGDTKVHHHTATTLIPATALVHLDFYNSLLPGTRAATLVPLQSILYCQS